MNDFQVAQQQYLERSEQRRLAASIAIPTNPSQVHAWLRELGEPIILFGETLVERRERLRLEIGKRGGLEALPRLKAAHDDHIGALKKYREEHAVVGKRPGVPEILGLRKVLIDFWAAHRARYSSNHITNGLKFELAASSCVTLRPLTTLACGEMEIAVADRDGNIIFLDHDLQEKARLQRDSAVSQLTYGTGLFLSSEFDGKVAIFRHHEVVISFSAHSNGRAYQSSWHPSGQYFATCGADGAWNYWSTEHVCQELGDQRQPLFTHHGHHPNLGIRTIGIDPIAGALVITGGGDGAVRIWDTRIGKCIMTGSAHVQPVICSAFLTHTPGSIVTGAMDNVVNVWDLRSVTGPAYTIPAHNAPITSLYNYNANCFLSCSLDGTIKAWRNDRLLFSATVDLTMPCKLVSIAGNKQGPDRFFTGSHDRTVRDWQINA